MKVFTIKSEKEIDEVAASFLEYTANNRVYAFFGQMGAGKTTFIKALCKKLEVSDTVSSPTFALVYEYQSVKAGPVYHFDLYRVKDVSELFDLGYEDYFYSGNLCFIEWPEIAQDLLPENTVMVKFEVNPDESRSLKVE